MKQTQDTPERDGTREVVLTDDKGVYLIISNQQISDEETESFISENSELTTEQENLLCDGEW